MISVLISLLFLCIHACSDKQGLCSWIEQGRENDENVKVNRDPPGRKFVRTCLLLHSSQSDCVLRLICVCGFVCTVSAQMCATLVCIATCLGLAEADSHSAH